MAYRPCLTCGQRFFGAADYTYVTWFDGESRMAFRLCQCSSCAADFRNPVSEQADSRSDDDWAAAPGAPPIQFVSAAAAQPSEAAAISEKIKSVAIGGRASSPAAG